MVGKRERGVSEACERETVKEKKMETERERERERVCV